MPGVRLAATPGVPTWMRHDDEGLAVRPRCSTCRQRAQRSVQPLSGARAQRFSICQEWVSAWGRRGTTSAGALSPVWSRANCGYDGTVGGEWGLNVCDVGSAPYDSSRDTLKCIQYVLGHGGLAWYLMGH